MKNFPKKSEKSAKNFVTILQFWNKLYTQLSEILLKVKLGEVPNKSRQISISQNSQKLISCYATSTTVYGFAFARELNVLHPGRFTVSGSIRSIKMYGWG